MAYFNYVLLFNFFFFEILYGYHVVEIWVHPFFFEISSYIFSLVPYRFYPPPNPPMYINLQRKFWIIYPYDYENRDTSTKTRSPKENFHFCSNICSYVLFRHRLFRETCPNALFFLEKKFIRIISVERWLDGDKEARWRNLRRDGKCGGADVRIRARKQPHENLSAAR